MGKILRVSGPVVIAEDVEKARMYDVVRVGNLGLVGEVIRLSGNKATIQVYEDTSGIRPGEKVENVGRPLSVDLGPGLLKSIYDGIQRPLDVIRTQTGDFIRRGYSANPLDEEKLWEFEPSAKKGDKVSEGQVIGTVEETSIITHKVMVPFGVSGKILEINKGKFKVSDTIAVIETESGKKDVRLKQEWPVRMARKVLRKLPPEIPLITGQRVIDTFFPVAKGGTVAVPGPFGSGKCVTGDTEIVTSDGKIERIENLYKQYAGSERKYEKLDEEIVMLEKDLSLFSFNNRKIERSSTNILYRGKSNSIVSITTKTGRKIKVTPVHKLFKVNSDGRITETMSKDLKEGDYILSVRKIDVNNTDAETDLYKIPRWRVADREIRNEVSDIVKIAIENGVKINLPKNILNGLARSRNRIIPKIQWLKEIYGTAEMPLPVPKRITDDTGNNVVKIPQKASKEFAEFLGYYAANGSIRENENIVFSSRDKDLIERFSSLSNKLFGIKNTINQDENDISEALIKSEILVDFIRSLSAGESKELKRIPELILTSSNTTLASFLSAYYLASGTFDSGKIELKTESKDLILELSYSLTRFGILHTLSEVKNGSEIHHAILISGKNDLVKLSRIFRGDLEKIRYLRKYAKSLDNGDAYIDVVPLSRRMIGDVYGKRFSQSLSNGHESKTSGRKKSIDAIPVDSFKELVHEYSEGNNKLVISHENTLSRLANALDYVYCDEVVSKEQSFGNFDVYDFSVPKYGSNFVGGFGGVVLHNTVVQHQLSKWANSDIVVYVGCGERGNEMTEILTTFPELQDPRSGKPLMERTVLIANTSNMPVAAREASIYTGITIAEYYRDMGYDVALMADSTSRWAEALREISGRLEEMPGEEGYPAYLGRRLSEFYERSGNAQVTSSEERYGSITIVGAVSPPGGDISEPVSQNTLRVTRVFWALDASLASRRHFPSINWLNSYSLYQRELTKWFSENVSEEWSELYSEAMGILQKESELQEVVQLVGYDALPEREKSVLDVARMIREDFLQQSAFDEIDSYCSIRKQYLMLKAIMEMGKSQDMAIEKGLTMTQLQTLPVREKISRMKEVKEEDIDKYQEALLKDIKAQIESLLKEA